MTETELDNLFAALAHPGRRRMLDLLRESPGLSVAALAAHFDMSGVGVLKHVGILETANLVVSRRAGRERRLFFNAVPIQLVHDRWTDQYSRFWSARMADIKDRLESRASSRKAAKSA
ncbi:MAG: winged helix-turn-helix transcriptional regulator [Phycisphaerae bacterium]|nr:winged helix-turn-helix transcriptional regulator [Phycisphaerae bacterium]